MTGRRLPWERVSSSWWVCAVGYVQQERGAWMAYVYRNTRTGESWTEQKPGFGSADGAKRWVEEQAEE